MSIRTGMFNPDEAKYANGILVELPYPTKDVRLITTAALQAIDLGTGTARPRCC